MKQILLIVSMLLSLGVAAQTDIPVVPSAQMPAIDLELCWNKTTFLVFPAAILHADRGERYVLADKIRVSGNILRVKAGQRDFIPSNLNVVTADGKVYTFNVRYSETAPSLPVYIGKLPPYAPVTFPGLSLNEHQIEQYASVIAARPPDMKKARYHRHGMDLRLEGIYIKDDVLFFRYRLKNSSAIAYNESAIRFYVRDKRQARRTAVQDKECETLHVASFGSPEDPEGQCIIAVFPRFSIAEKKNFTVELMEKDGDRNPYCHLDQDLLLKARSLR